VVDPSLYAQCFTGQEILKEYWCGYCMEFDHWTVNCSFRSRKWSWTTGHRYTEQTGKEAGGGSKLGLQAGLKFNRYNGDCRYGWECKFAHVCTNAVSKCSGQ